LSFSKKLNFYLYSSVSHHHNQVIEYHLCICYSIS